MIQVDNPPALLSQVLISVNHPFPSSLMITIHPTRFIDKYVQLFFMTFHLKVADILNELIHQILHFELAHPPYPKESLKLNVADLTLVTNHQMKMQFSVTDY